MSSNRGSIWPDADPQLRELWANGLETRAIGKALGVSSNAVVGRAHRIHLPARESPIKRDPNKPAAIRARPIRRIGGKPLPLNPPTTTPPPPAPLPTRLRGTCQWPIGEPGNKAFRLCGEEAEVGKPYCSDHCKLAYTGRPGRHDDA